MLPPSVSTRFKWALKLTANLTYNKTAGKTNLTTLWKGFTNFCLFSEVRPEVFQWLKLQPPPT